MRRLYTNVCSPRQQEASATPVAHEYRNVGGLTCIERGSPPLKDEKALHLKRFGMHVDMGSLWVAVLLGGLEAVVDQGTRATNEHADVQDIPFLRALHGSGDDPGHVGSALEGIGRQGDGFLSTVVKPAVVWVAVEVGSTSAAEVLPGNMLEQGGGSAAPDHVDVLALADQVGYH